MSNLVSSADVAAATAGYIKEKIENARQALVDTGLYLGVNAPALLPMLKWAHVGKADLLVTEDSSAALLSAVVQISEEHFYLTSCGKWKGPSEIAPALADARASCIGIAPTHETVADEFSTVLENVRLLFDTGSTNGVTQRKGVLMGTTGLRFRHILFERLEVEGDATLASDSEALPWECTMAGWTTDTDSALAKSALEAMVDTHRVNYIPAYDVDGNLIDRREYQKHLEGATVQVHFTLCHWGIKRTARKEACDTFVADIFSMRVLIPPENYRRAINPRKRKYHRTDPLTPDIAPKQFAIFAKSGTSSTGTKKAAKKNVGGPRVKERKETGATEMCSVEE